MSENESLPNEEKVFQYLDALRESGDTNMFGATPYVMSEFGMKRDEARKYLVRWMNTFGKRHSEREG